ncbi:YhcN/YlaJ family sporulation lipoprotein [Pseudalkalibacillus sp. R45]|uniref:YhcN/YlaJ family sporulation lipoprotein n=1 Tax=Pseudalkalibacillus sp. R45 TaxID=3457433 RepID=UPI003FCD394A
MFKKVIVILLAVNILAACNNGDEALDQAWEENYSNPGKTRISQKGSTLQNSPQVKERASESAQAEELVKMTEQVDGVDKADAIVTGMYSVVGAKLEKGVDQNAVVNEIYSRLDDISQGANAVVTTDPQHLKKMNEWGKEINKRGFHKGIYNELVAMMSQIPAPEREIHESNPSKMDLDRERINHLPNTPR